MTSCLSNQKLKLTSYGIPGKVLEWIKKFLANRKKVVKVENARSNPVPVLAVIDQGTCLQDFLHLFLTLTI